MEREHTEALARRAVLQGDAAAWESLYRQHFAVVAAFVRRRLGAEVGAVEDTLQDIWMTAVRRIRSFDPQRAAFRSWMLGIAANACRSERRRASDRGEPLPEELAAPLTERLGDQPALVPEALATLDPEAQSLLRDRYELGHPLREMAQARGKSEKAVESALARARTTLRGSLQKLFGQEGSPLP